MGSILIFSWLDGWVGKGITVRKVVGNIMLTRHIVPLEFWSHSGQTNELLVSLANLAIGGIVWPSIWAIDGLYWKPFNRKKLFNYITIIDRTIHGNEYDVVYGLSLTQQSKENVLFVTDFWQNIFQTFDWNKLLIFILQTTL